MKKILAIFFALACGIASAQTFQVQNLNVAGTSAFAGASTFSSSAAFSVAPTSVTPSVTDNSTKLATTAALFARDGCRNIVAYGGVGDGTTDNGAAFTAAVAAGPSGRACVYFPAGKFAFTSGIAYTMPSNTASLMLVGAGSDLTELTWPTLSGANAVSINLLTQANSIHVRDMSFTTGQNGLAPGVVVTQNTATITNPAASAGSDFINVVFRGNDGYAVTNNWNPSVKIVNASNFNFVNVIIPGYVTGATGGYQTGGSGITLVGTSSATAVVFNFIGCTINYVGIGLQVGTYTQGVTVLNSNFTGGNIGVYSPSNPGGTAQLYVGGSQFNNALGGILTSSPIANTMIIGNLFYVPAGGNGIFLDQNSIYTIIGNTFNVTGSTSNQVGINIHTAVGTSSGVITGNSIQQMGTGIFLQSGSARVNVQSNAYALNTTNVTNSGTGNTVGGGSQ